MPLPIIDEKKYYKVDELAVRWNCSQSLIIKYIKQKLIHPGLLVRNTKTEVTGPDYNEKVAPITDSKPVFRILSQNDLESLLSVVDSNGKIIVKSLYAYSLVSIRASSDPLHNGVLPGLYYMGFDDVYIHPPIALLDSKEIGVNDILFYLGELKIVEDVNKIDISEYKKKQYKEFSAIYDVNKKKQKRLHGNVESNAQKREQILGAAAAILAKYPDLCRDGKGNIKATKLRNVIEEKAALFWSEGEPPLRTEPIEKLLRKWLSKMAD